MRITMKNIVNMNMLFKVNDFSINNFNLIFSYTFGKLKIKSLLALQIGDLVSNLGFWFSIKCFRLLVFNLGF